MTVNDGRDFVPTKPHVVFAHHFSAIAGAGPILGPTMAILYGFVPGLAVGRPGRRSSSAPCTTSRRSSSRMREGGRSLAEVARKTLGKQGFNLVIAFTIVMIVLVTSSFLSRHRDLAHLAVAARQDRRERKARPSSRRSTVDGVVMGRIGGIASTSVIVITLASPLLGWLIFKRGINTILAYLLAAAICVASVAAGHRVPREPLAHRLDGDHLRLRAVRRRARRSG